MTSGVIDGRSAPEERSLMQMSVRCVRAKIGYERYEGKPGTLRPLPLPLLAYQFLPLGEATDIILDPVADWRFESLASGFPVESVTQPSAVDPIVEASSVAEPPMRRAREKYNASIFSDELEVALAQVRDRVIEARRTSAAQPHLPEGISMQDATLRVVEALVLRKLTGEFEEILDMIIDDTRVMLLHKNAAYGDSALNPVRVFSKAPIAEQLLVRLDDKVSRLMRGSAAGEDVAGDALGYLVLVEMAERRECSSR